MIKELSEPRDITIDLIKGIGIILMVFRHTEAPYSEFVLLFHMAIFFIASGYLYKSYKIKTIGDLYKYFLRKLKSLYLPFFVFSTSFILLNNIFLKLNLYTDNPEFLKEYSGSFATLGNYLTLPEMFKKIFSVFFFRGSPQLGGALWFLQTLFFLSVGYSVIEFISQKVITNNSHRFLFQGVLAVCFLYIGYFCYLYNVTFYGLNRFFSYYCLYYLGNILKERKIMNLLQRQKNSSIILIASFSFLILISMPFTVWKIALVSNNYINPAVLITASVLGWFMIYSLAILLKRRNFTGNSALVYISNHSVAILALHFLAFKIVNWFAVEIYGMNYYMIAAFPVLMDGIWWVAYLSVGLVLPLLLDKAFQMIKIKVMKKKAVAK